MLIGNRWVEDTRLKILNGFLALGAAWGTYDAQIQTNLTERGFVVGLSHMGGDAVNHIAALQILFDGQPAHQGFLRFAMDNNVARMGNQQPTTMSMPQLDIPPNTVVEVRGQITVGVVNPNSYVDLIAVVYYIKDWEAAPAVCFPTDVVAPDPV